MLATDAADIAPLAQAAWLSRAAVTMLQQPTPRTDLAVWLADTVRATQMIKADVVVIGEQFLGALDPLTAQGLAVCTVESLRRADPIELDIDGPCRRVGYRDAAVDIGINRHAQSRRDQSRQSRRECRRFAPWARTRCQHGRDGELAAAVS